MNNTWYDRFLLILHKKYGKKSQLVEELMDLLYIEREAVYRRLRNEVVFSALEVGKIAEKWDISLDDIMEINPKEVLFKSKLFDYTDTSLDNLRSVMTTSEMLRCVKQHSDSEYVAVSNKLPHMLTAGFMNLYKFCLLKQAYQYANENINIFWDNLLKEDTAKSSLEFYDTLKNISNTHFVWDSMIFDYIVRDVQYFHSIYLLNNEQKGLIKKDLYGMLNYMLEVSSRGYWPETGNEVTIYISHISIDTNYHYFSHFGEVKLCCVDTFGKNEIYTRNNIMAENFKDWLHTMKKLSVRISQIDEKSRIKFFTKQQQIIDSL